MSDPAPTVLVVEDVLSEGVLKKLLRSFGSKYSIVSCLGREGYGFIRKNMAAFNRAASESCFVILTDLDDNECPFTLRRLWLSEPLHANLLFRVSVVEVEAWLLAHRKGFARFLGVSMDRIPKDTHRIRHPKEFIVDLAKSSSRRAIREALTPRDGRRGRVGSDYNGTLLYFVEKHWSFQAARRNSHSLDRALAAFARYEPAFSRSARSR